MKRIVLIAAAVAGLFAAAITTVASAATTHTTSKFVTVNVTKLKRETTTVTARSKCTLHLTTIAPPGEAVGTPGEPSGDQYGASYCSGLKGGSTGDSFTTNASGAIVGKIQHWFRDGTMFGTYTLIPVSASGPPTATSFGSASYTGTVKITKGQGVLYGTTGTGTLRCATPDSTHFTCTEKLKLTQTETKLVPTIVQMRVKTAA